jgi:hypothetical protein
MKDKRGLQLALNTIVVLVLAILVLAYLVLFFTEAGKGFLDTIRGYSSYSNVDVVVDNCNLLVDTDAQYSYCCEERNVKFLNDGEKDEGEFNCLEVGERFGNVKTMSCEGVSC